MKTYRKSFVVMLMYAIPAILVLGALVATLFVYLVSVEQTNELSFWMNCALALSGVLFLVYMAYQTSIRIQVSSDTITIKRLFIKKYEGFLNETQMRGNFTVNSNFLRPTSVLLFVKGIDMDAEIRIVANGLGHTRANRMLEETFDITNSPTTRSLDTLSPQIKNKL